uniref:Uncharacterized protein n=1 Tax=Anguilla anguilla TaxID=7936 RepID=A0A0E9U665_ANGAN
MSAPILLQILFLVFAIVCTILQQMPSPPRPLLK